MTLPNEQDALELAKAELADNMVLDPKDLLQDVGPLAQMWYIHEAAYGVMTGFVGMLSGDEAADVGDKDGPSLALQALAKACGMLDQACVYLSLLPDDASNPG